MAAPGGKFFVQDRLKDKAPHHESYQQLWDLKWKGPASMGVYPFMFGAKKDFDPIVEDLTKCGFKEPYDWDEYAPRYWTKAEELAFKAMEAEKEGDKEKASEYYLRSSAVYRISRFPAPRSMQQKLAWQKGKEVCLKGLSLREYPVEEVLVPHKHAIEGEGPHIPVYYLKPRQASKYSPVPLVIIFTGLDGYRTELAVWMEGWRQVGVATVVVEIPGTGDSPAKADDPLSPDRQWSSLLDWIDEQEAVNHDKVCVWAFSTGAYYGIRIAHTHADRLAAVVALGGGCHHMFDKEWLENVNHLEYPFDLANTLCYKWGYGDDIERFKREASDRFSLLKDGTLDKPHCARLLLVNGTEDEVFPIDDYYLALQHGAIKEARFMADTKHMGEPQSFFIIIPWLYKIFGIKAAPQAQLATLPFKSQYP